MEPSHERYPEFLDRFDLLDRAEEFYVAFKALPATPPPSWPRYFMLCHAVELVLKAYLSSQGMRRGELKKMERRHNLVRLLTDAVNAGLEIGPLARGEIGMLSEAHSKFWHRYPKQDGKPVFVIDPFEPYAIELLEAVAVAIRGPQYRRYLSR